MVNHCFSFKQKKSKHCKIKFLSSPCLVWGTVKTQNVFTSSLMKDSVTFLHGHPAILLKLEPHIAFLRESFENL